VVSQFLIIIDGSTTAALIARRVINFTLRRSKRRVPKKHPSLYHRSSLMNLSIARVITEDRVYSSPCACVIFLPFFVAAATCLPARGFGSITKWIRTGSPIYVSAGDKFLGDWKWMFVFTLETLRRLNTWSPITYYSLSLCYTRHKLIFFQRTEKTVLLKDLQF